MIARSVLLVVTLVLLAQDLNSHAAEPETVVPVDGARFPATLEGLDQDGQLTFDQAGNKKTLTLDELVRWGTPRDPKAGSLLVLNHGAVVVATNISLADDQLSFDSSLLGESSIELDQVRGIMLRLPASSELQDELLQRIATDPSEADRLVLINGDELSGTITALDAHEITINANVGEIDVAPNRVEAVLQSTKLLDSSPAPSKGIWVGLSDGTRILVDRASLNDGELTLSLHRGSTWKAPADALVWLQPLSPRVVYLSDLDAAGFRHIPLLDLSWEYQRDRNVLGTALRSGDRRYQKGLGMHSACRLTYRLDEPFSRFEAELALDSSSSLGSVVFRVYVGTEQRFASDVIRAGDPPLPISVDVSGGRSLSLLVEFAERGDVQDYANLLDARLVR